MAEQKMEQQNDGNPWQEVFNACCKNNIDVKVKQVSEWGLDIMDMLHADKQDFDALCEALGLEGGSTKKFRDAVSKCSVKYSQWAFLNETFSEEKQCSELISKLNKIEKSCTMISDNDLKFSYFVIA